MIVLLLHNNKQTERGKQTVVQQVKLNRQVSKHGGTGPPSPHDASAAAANALLSRVLGREELGC